MNTKKDINYLKETIEIYKNMIKYEYDNIFNIVFDILLTYSINYNYTIKNLDKINNENVLKELEKLIRFIEKNN